MTAPGIWWTSVPQDHTIDDTKALKKVIGFNGDKLNTLIQNR